MRSLYVLVSAICFLVLGCKTTSVRSSNSQSTSYLRASRSELSTCSNSSKGWLTYVNDEKKFYACDGASWSEADIKGPAGNDGQKGTKGDKGDVGGYSVYANSVLIGPLVSAGFGGPLENSGAGVLVLSSTKHLILIGYEGTFREEILLFESADCTGDGYVPSEMVPNGSVFKPKGRVPLVYLPKDAMVQSNFVANSSIGYRVADGVCGVGWGPTSAKKVLPNDSLVTGVNVLSYNPPITIE